MATPAKVLTGYAALARFMPGLGEPIGFVARHHAVASSYSYSPCLPVYKYDGWPVVVAETRHKRYEVHRINAWFVTTEQAAEDEFIAHRWGTR